MGAEAVGRGFRRFVGFFFSFRRCSRCSPTTTRSFWSTLLVVYAKIVSKAINRKLLCWICVGYTVPYTVALG